MQKDEKSPASINCNHERKNGGLLGKPGTFSRKLNVGCLVIMVPLFCLVV